MEIGSESTLTSNLRAVWNLQASQAVEKKYKTQTSKPKVTL